MSTEIQVRWVYLVPFVLAIIVPVAFFAVGLTIFRGGTRRRERVGGVVMVLAVLLMAVWLFTLVVPTR